MKPLLWTILKSHRHLMLWDIFCKVIDNHGDLGVCWRLSSQLAGRGEQVRLWVDSPAALGWMAPAGHPGIQVLPWDGQAGRTPGEVVIEAFGCEPAARFQAAMAGMAGGGRPQPAWINLEYLTAEAFAERNHKLPSPLLSGPAAGLTRYFFYPGFTAGTGGLLREDDLMQRQAQFAPGPWLRALGVDTADGARRISLFCYEPAALGRLLLWLARGPGMSRLLITPGRAATAAQAALERMDGVDPGWNHKGLLSISWLPLLTQPDYDHLLWACDLNFVRGEDSLVRAIWAGKPLVWHIYPQDDGAHHRKLDAFLQWLGAPAGLRDFHGAWNGPRDELPPPQPELWSVCVRNARERLLTQTDLASQLTRFVHELGAAP
jgi:uncharacterized repeat protein (TIGR03837 family)